MNVNFDISQMFPTEVDRHYVTVLIDNIERKIDWVSLEINCVSIVDKFIFKYDMDLMLYKYSSFYEDEWHYMTAEETDKLYHYFEGIWQAWLDEKRKTD